MKAKTKGRSRLEELEARYKFALKKMDRLLKEMRAAIKAKDSDAYIRAMDRFDTLEKDFDGFSPELMKEYQARSKDRVSRLAAIFVEAVMAGRLLTMKEIKEIMESNNY